MPDVKDRQYLITLYKKARKYNFDVDQYNRLKRELTDVETDLRRLRDPLYHRYSTAAALAPPTAETTATAAAAGAIAAGIVAAPAKPKGRIAQILDVAAKKLKK